MEINEDKINSTIRTIENNIKENKKGWNIVLWDRTDENGGKYFGYCSSGFCEENKGKDSLCKVCPLKEGKENG